MQVFWDVFWITWIAMLVIGDPVAILTKGEQASDTHFLVTHISIGIRAGIIGWLAWHFLVAHVRN